MHVKSVPLHIPLVIITTTTIFIITVITECYFMFEKLRLFVKVLAFNSEFREKQLRFVNFLRKKESENVALIVFHTLVRHYAVVSRSR